MNTRIFWAGDSTVAQNDYTTYPQSGIGQGMRLFIKKEIEIKNHAINGRSTKSFIEQSRLAAIYDEITESDFLFIQFGHNDEKIEDKERFTEPYGEFQINLEKYVSVARNKKAYPLLITPLYRRWFLEDGTLDQTVHKEYQRAMIETAIKLEVPYVDLCLESKKLLEQTEPKESAAWFMHLKPNEYQNYPEGKEDNTHLKWKGALIFSYLLAKEIVKLGKQFQELFIEPAQLI